MNFLINLTGFNTYSGKAVVLRTPKLGVLRISVEWGAARWKAIAVNSFYLFEKTRAKSHTASK